MLADLHRQFEHVDFADFGGIEIVRTYGDPQAEYSAIRKGCGLIDLAQRGVLELIGKDRHDFLGNLLTNKTWDKATRTGMTAGEGRYAFFLNLKGRVVADMTLIERGDRLLIDLDRRLVSMLRDTLDKYVFAEKLTFADRSTTHTRLGLLGPGAAAVVYDAAGTDLASTGEFGSADVTLFGVPVTVWREDWTASPNLHLHLPLEHAATVWRGLLDAFGDLGQTSNKRRLRPIGWAAFNTCRIEAGRPWLGIDYEPAPPSTPGRRKAEDVPEDPAAKGILPAETGLFERAVDVTKGCYLGQEIVARMYARKVVARQIVGLRMSADALPLPGSEVLEANSPTQIGIVTSSTVSPILSNACIALALVKRPHYEVGKALRVVAEGAVHLAQVVAMPFVQA